MPTAVFDKVQRPQVMLLDDDRDMLELLSVMLERHAVYTQCFTEPAKLFTALRATYPDVVVTDLQIDHVDGLDVVRRLASDYPDVLCVVLSGETARRQAALDAGVDLFLLKPIAGHSLASELINLVVRHRAVGRPH